jgi:hypothetical protein
MKNRLWRIQEQANHGCAQNFFGKRDFDFLNDFLNDFLSNFLTTLIRAIVICTLLSLAACDSSGDENLSEWMATVRRTVHTSPLTLPAPLTTARRGRCATLSGVWPRCALSGFTFPWRFARCS